MLLSGFIDKFSSLKVLCVGDIMLDRFIYGSVTRISPEAPVPVFNFKNQKEMLGGAGNVVANLSSLGCGVSFVGVVGDDENGKRISSLLKEINVTSHLFRLNFIPTIVKTRLIAGNNHLLRMDMEEKFPDPETVLTKLERISRIAVRSADIILLSDYNKGTLSEAVIQTIIRQAEEYGKKVIVDPKGSDYSKYAGAYLVKPNLKEFVEATGIMPDPLRADFKDKLKQGAVRLYERCKIKKLLVTLSEHGMAYISADDDEDAMVIPTVAKEVFDVSGAGDTTLAALGAAIGTGATIKEAMKLANTASGIAIGKLGTACVSADELKNAINEKPAEIWIQKKKIVSAKQAVEIFSALKARGKKIGFTNGCFDLLHQGHLASFIRAKKECDVLCVGMNTDASVKRLKGPTRPIQDEKTRALLVASLEFVDYVVLFDEDTALPLIEQLQPDVICKEGYTLDKWPEAAFVLSYGGRAVTLPRVDGVSTSATVQKMKG